MKKAVNIVLGPRSWTREPDPTDSWDVGDEDCEVSIEVIKSDRPNYDSTGTELDFPFYAVYAKYYTGSTFGQEAAGVVLGAYPTEEEAEEAANRHLADKSYAVPWNGYFESLGYVQVERVDGFTNSSRRYYGV